MTGQTPSEKSQEAASHDQSPSHRPHLRRRSSAAYGISECVAPAPVFTYTSSGSDALESVFDEEELECSGELTQWRSRRHSSSPIALSKLRSADVQSQAAESSDSHPRPGSHGTPGSPQQLHHPHFGPPVSHDGHSPPLCRITEAPNHPVRRRSLAGYGISELVSPAPVQREIFRTESLEDRFDREEEEHRSLQQMRRLRRQSSTKKR